MASARMRRPPLRPERALTLRRRGAGLVPALTVLLAGALLAGCAQGPAVPAPAPAADATQEALAALGASVVPGDPAAANATADAQGGPGFQVTVEGTGSDWAVAALPLAGPERAVVAGFVWQPPAGADGAAMEIVPIDDGAGIDEAIIAVFALGDPAGPNATGGPADLLAVGVATAVTTTTKLTAALTESATATPSAQPMQTWLASDGPVGIALAARGEAAAFGVALRIMGREQEPPASWDALLQAQREAGPALALAPRATGEGAQAAFYLDRNLVLGFFTPVPGMWGHESWAGAVQVDDALPTALLRPHPHIRDVSLSSSFAADRGWGVAAGWLTTWSGTYSWSLQGEVHGNPATAQASMGLVEDTRFLVAGSGPGASDPRWQVTGADGDVIQELWFFSLDMGLGVEELFGADGLTHGGETGSPRVASAKGWLELAF